jgi:hypothetical protein
VGGAGLGLHKAVDILPLVAGAHGGAGPLAATGPNPTEDGLEAHAVFVFGPQLDSGVRMRLLQGGGAGR